LYAAVLTTAYPGPATGVSNPDRVIALVYLWAAAHRRSTAWVCQPAQLAGAFGRPCPSPGHPVGRRAVVQPLTLRVRLAPFALALPRETGTIPQA
jgi:hypothetical protein